LAAPSAPEENAVPPSSMRYFEPEIGKSHANAALAATQNMSWRRTKKDGELRWNDMGSFGVNGARKGTR